MFCGDVCSDDFVKAIGAEQFGYKHDSGSVTDVGELVKRGVGISCLNLSCGYYEAHTDEEVTILSELENCLHFVEHIIETCTEVYPFVYEYVGFGRNYNYYGVDYNAYRIGCQKSKKSVVDAYTYYFDAGYYDEDVNLMTEYFETMPNLTFDQVKAYYMVDFSAYGFFDQDECESQLKDIYDIVKDMFEPDFWDSENDDDVVGEISFDDVTLKKVS